MVGMIAVGDRLHKVIEAPNAAAVIAGSSRLRPEANDRFWRIPGWPDDHTSAGWDPTIESGRFIDGWNWLRMPRNTI